MIFLFVYLLILGVWLVGLIPAARIELRRRMLQVVCRNCHRPRCRCLYEWREYPTMRGNPLHPEVPAEKPVGKVLGEVRQRNTSDAAYAFRRSLAWPVRLSGNLVAASVLRAPLTAPEQRRKLAEQRERIEANAKEIESLSKELDAEIEEWDCEVTLEGDR